MKNIRRAFCAIILSIAFFHSVAYAADAAVHPHVDGPPFFKIVFPNGRNVYVLGALHDVSLQRLSETAYNEVGRIAIEEQATLFLEHDISPDMYLHKFQEVMHQAKKAGAVQQRIIDYAKAKGGTSIPDFEKLPLDKFVLPHVTLREVLNSDAPLWLANLIFMSTLRNSFHEDGLGEDFEGEILHSFPWRSVNYLEEPADAFKILEGLNDNQYEHQDNLNATISSINSLIEYEETKILPKAARSQLINAEKNQLIPYYTWGVSIRRNVLDIPPSVFQRNVMWEKKLEPLLEQEDEGKEALDVGSILIIVGDGHLAGKLRHDSFLYLIAEQSGDLKNVYRFNGQGKWINAKNDLK